MTNQIDSFFSNDEHANKVKDAVDSASATGGGKSNPISVAGEYIVKCKTIVAKKKDGELLVVPKVGLSDSAKTKGAMQLNVCYEVVEGTDAVPEGSSAFSTITLAQASGATDEKIRNTASFMKSTICTLTGLKEFSFNKDFVIDYLTIDYNETTFKVTRNHKMNERFMAICEEYDKAGGQIGVRVKSIRPLRPGDHSKSIKREATGEQELMKMDDEIAGSMGTVTSEPLEYDPSLDMDNIKIEDA